MNPFLTLNGAWQSVTEFRGFGSLRWGIEWSPQELGPSPIDSAHRETSIPLVSTPSSTGRYPKYLRDRSVTGCHAAWHSVTAVRPAVRTLIFKFYSNGATFGCNNEFWLGWMVLVPGAETSGISVFRHAESIPHGFSTWRDHWVHWPNFIPISSIRTPWQTVKSLFLIGTKNVCTP